MSDDDQITPFRSVEPNSDPDILLYDYSKYLLTLALLVIGGVLSLLQGNGGAEIGRFAVIIVLASLAISGLASLSCANSIVRARQSRADVPRVAAIANQAAMFFLGMGVAAFLATWIASLL